MSESLSPRPHTSTILFPALRCRLQPPRTLLEMRAAVLRLVYVRASADDRQRHVVYERAGGGEILNRA